MFNYQINFQAHCLIGKIENGYFLKKDENTPKLIERVT